MNSDSYQKNVSNNLWMNQTHMNPHYNGDME